MFKKNSKSLLESSIASHQATGLSAPVNPSPFTHLESYRNKSTHTTTYDTSIEDPEVYIGENVRIEGLLSFDKLAQIDGVFSGEVVSKGKIIIGPHATVKADLFLDEAHIEGTLEGNITVSTRLVLLGQAKVIGDIIAPSITVHEGVTIRGQLHVTKITSPLEQEEESPFVPDPI